MPNTTNVSQTLPIFAPTKNGQSAIALKTQNNNNFNQLLKSEVANKAKKTQIDNARQQANNKALSAPPKPNSTKIESNAKSPDQNLSTVDKESDEVEQTASAPIDNTNLLLNFVGDIQALAHPNNNNGAEQSVDPSITSQSALAPASLDTAAVSTQTVTNMTVSDTLSADTNTSTENLSEAFADPITKARIEGMNSAPKDASKMDAEVGTDTQIAAESPDSASSEQAPPLQAQNSTIASSRLVEPSIHQQSNDKLDKLTKLDTTVNEAKQQGQGEQIIAADSNTSVDINLDKKPPTLHSEKQMIDAQVAILNANRRVSTSESTSTEKESATEISSSELAPTDRRIALNANERSASDQFSINLKAHTQAARESDVDQQPQNKQEIKITELPRAESLTPAPQMQASAEANSVSATSNFIGPRVGTKMWDQAIGQKVIWMVAGGEQSAQLTLNPPDLGPVQVVLSISDNQVDASFVSSHLDVREAIEAAAPKLREMMDNAGMSLAGFSVNAQSTASSNAFGSSGDNRNHGTANNTNRGVGAETNQNTQMQNTSRSNPSNSNGLVDTFA